MQVSSFFKSTIEFLCFPPKVGDVRAIAATSQKLPNGYPILQRARLKAISSKQRICCRRFAIGVSRKDSLLFSNFKVQERDLM